MILQLLYVNIIILQVFDPNNAPPVSIDKPSYNFGHRISVISADCIQNLKHEDKTTYLPSESSDAAITENYTMHVDGCSELSGSIASPTGQSVVLQGTSFDHQMHMSDSTLQVTMEDKVYQSTTHNSLNAQNLQDDNYHNESDDNQVSFLTADDNLIREEPLSTSDYLPSNVPLTSDGMIQLDVPVNEEYNEDSVTCSQSYITVLECDSGGLQNNYQDLPWLNCSTDVSLSTRSPVAMIDKNTTDLDALNVDWSLADGNLPPTNSTSPKDLILDVAIVRQDNYVEGNTIEPQVDEHVHAGQPPPTTAQYDLDLDFKTEENSSLVEDIISEVDYFKLDGYRTTEKFPPSSPTSLQEDDSLVLDLDEESVVCFDFTGDTSEGRNSSNHLDLQQHHQNAVEEQNANGYLSESLCAEGNIHISEFMSLQPHSFNELHEGHFTSGSSPYILGVGYQQTGDPTFITNVISHCNGAD